MIAAYPGSFDPFTKGHVDILKRSSALFDLTYVLVSTNWDKDHMFDFAERKEIAERSIKDVMDKSSASKIKVVTHMGITADFLNSKDVDVVVRGLRDGYDLNYEIDLEQYLRATTKVETVYLTPMTENLNTSSSLVRMFLKSGRVKPTSKYLCPSAYSYILDLKRT